MTTDAAHQRDLIRARGAVFALFASFGVVIATWAVHLPSVKDATGISTSRLGLVLLVLGIGAITGMQLSGLLIDRLGSSRIAVIGVAAMAIALPAPLAMHSWWGVLAGALVLGVATGIGEVGINAAAVDVERDYSRPIMGSFHAVFSVGNVVGALLGAACFALSVGVLATAIAVSVLALVAVSTAAGVLSSRIVVSQPNADAHDVAEPEPSQPPIWRVALLGVLAFLLLLAEGSAMDWSSLHSQQHLGASPSTGALALGCFVAAMTIGRFRVDRIAERVGAVRTVRWGSAAAAAGIALVVVSPVLPLTLIGWAVLGLGLSGGVPQVFTAAGNLTGSAGKSLSRVVGTGYVAILAGPGLIGWLADLLSLDCAFLLPLCGVLICACAARTVAPAPP
ncbi:MFS transporter [Mycolicibacterium sp. 120266]|uniref:MFS transporter n=1 Tax=Mycolicibacterium sp. 120266 TaxID=3090601 RepID=UPI00299E9178|nr:MFS transporter [Mycolicibacterium sp. 120266]MDX1876160.1 MFS transporter [Mycolicibacterium sp. 120266]